MSDKSKDDAFSSPGDHWIHLVIEGEEEVNFEKYNLTQKTFKPAETREGDESEIPDPDE